MHKKDYPIEWQELASQINSYREHAKGGDYGSRVLEWRENRAHLQGFKSSAELDYLNHKQPVTSMTWVQLQMQKAKVMGGQDFRPSVSTQAADNFNTGEANAEALVNVSNALQMSPDNVMIAKMREGVLRAEYENKDLDAKFEECLEASQWYGDSYMVLTVGDDGELNYDLVMPDDALRDTDVVDLQDGRYFSFRTRMTLAEIKRQWPRFADMVTPMTSGEMTDDVRDLQKSGTGDFKDQDFAFLECWWLRDDSTVRGVIDEVVAVSESEVAELIDEGYEIDHEQTITQPVIEQGALGDVTLDVPVEWVLQKMGDVPAYPGGIRKVYMASGIILDDPSDENCQHCDLSSGKFPVSGLPYYTAPGEPFGISPVRYIRPLASALDSLVESGIDISERLMPFIIQMQGKLELDSSAALGQNSKVRVLKLNGIQQDKDLDQVLRVIPGAELPMSMQNLMMQLQGYIDMLGGGNLRGHNNIPRDASDQFVRAMEDGDHARVSSVRRNLRRFVETVYEIALELLQSYNDTAKRYQVDTGYQVEQVKYAATDIDTGEDDFIVSVGGGSDMPHDPIERNAFIGGVIDQLSATPSKTLALGKLELMDIDNKAAIKSLLEKHFQEIEQAQQAAAQQPPMIDPDIAKRYNESSADVLEELGKKLGETQPEVALVIADQLADAAKGDPIDYQLIQATIRTIPVAPERGETIGVN